MKRLSSEEVRGLDVALREATRLVESGLLIPGLDEVSNIIAKGVLTSCLVNLGYILGKCDKLGARVAFSDNVADVRVINRRGEVTAIDDVTHLVQAMRNAMCHPETPLRVVYPSNCYLGFGVVVGKGVLMRSSDGTGEVFCEYEDDVAYHSGPLRLYLKRHICRAVVEAKDVLGPYMPGRGGRLNQKPKGSRA